MKHAFIDRINGYLIESRSPKMFMNIETGEVYGTTSKSKADRYFKRDGKKYGYNWKYIQLNER